MNRLCTFVSMSKKNRKNVVYSTNPDFGYEYEQDEQEETLPPGEQLLELHLDRKQRKGKPVTLVKGFIGTVEDLKELEKALKAKCGVGGSSKNGEIIIQGQVRDKVNDILKDLGYSTKKVGG